MNGIEQVLLVIKQLNNNLKVLNQALDSEIQKLLMIIKHSNRPHLKIGEENLQKQKKKKLSHKLLDSEMLTKNDYVFL